MRHESKRAKILIIFPIITVLAIDYGIDHGTTASYVLAAFFVVLGIGSWPRSR